MDAYSTITALARPNERAGLIATIFTVGYLAFSLPAVIAGSRPHTTACTAPRLSTLRSANRTAWLPEQAPATRKQTQDGHAGLAPIGGNGLY
jgi:hypothetical protein